MGIKIRILRSHSRSTGLFGDMAQKYVLTSFPDHSYAQKHVKMADLRRKCGETKEDPGWAEELPSGGDSGHRSFIWLSINLNIFIYKCELSINSLCPYFYQIFFFLLISKTLCLLSVLQVLALLTCHLPFNFVYDIFFLTEV